MNTIVVIQARTNSSRLPAKVLLPIAGLPIVVLSAKRAANTGLDTIVITSTEESDDILVKNLKTHKINHFRGSLDDTLNRFVTSLSSYHNDTIVVRLTADNVCPDGKLIDEVISDFLTRRLDYIICNGEDSGLPYGMSLEVTKLKLLREADKKSTSLFEKEHVTPYIIKHYGKSVFINYKKLGLGKINCTIDNLDDYLQLSKIFMNINKPIDISFLELNKLLIENFCIKNLCPPTKFVLGTAQLGLEYGITNQDGKPSRNESIKILTTALRAKVTSIDTASAYGDSEKIIGEFMASGFSGRSDIITKIFFTNEELKQTSLKELVSIKVYQTLIKLKKNHIDTLLLHRVDYLNVQENVIWETLLTLKSEGLISKLGVSVQNNEEALLALDFDAVEHIQLPFNILDWRWDDVIKKIEVVKEIKKLTVHCRSVFLQGLLLTNDSLLWKRAHILDTNSINHFFNALTTEFKLPIEQILLSYVTSQAWVDGVVVGVTNNKQLIDNLNSVAFSNHALDFSRLMHKRPILKAKSLNPSNWKVS